MRKVLSLLLLTVSLLASAQILEPVKWTSNVKMNPDGKGGVVTLRAKIDGGWHLYSMDLDPNIGPTPMSISCSTEKGVKWSGKWTPSPRATRQYDSMFETELAFWQGSVTVSRKFTATAPDVVINGTVRYGACNDQNCLPPSKYEFELKATAKPDEAAEKEAEAEAAEEAAADTDTVTAVETQAADTIAAAAPSADMGDIYAPVTFNQADNPADMGSQSLWGVFLMCFIGGFVALLTPCVWPMIPMTVSFFLKRSDNRAKAIRDAITYGLSIIIIYVLLGLVITLLFGADALNKLATNSIVNIIFFLLLVVFAISFFGAFDVKLPESWGNRMDAKAEKASGILAIFFMAFTLALVSFSCTGPIIGTLLVEAASTGDKLGPTVGMFGFALALAIPFCLFGMFPSWLKSAPKSGNWMAAVKVVLGFAELALSLKFLSVADLAYGWHILDRETFLSLWIVIFALCGLYLFGKFQFKTYGKADNSIGVFRFFLGMICLAFSVYLVPGLWGAPLKSVSAFVPPLFTQDLNLYGHELEEYDDYDAGMAKAAELGKPVFVDFSGYGCVNCRKMEGAVLDNSDVRALIDNNFVVITLMVDERKALPAPIKVVEDGKTVTLETYGEKWSYLQRTKFKANAQPYYVVLDPKGNLMSGPFVYEENIPKFSRFLEDGISNINKTQGK